MRAKALVYDEMPVTDADDSWIRAGSSSPDPSWTDKRGCAMYAILAHRVDAQTQYGLANQTWARDGKLKMNTWSLPTPGV